MKPKLLYIAYYFRPAQMIASVRTWNTAKHLSRLGWNVTVVTPKTTLWSNPEAIANVKHDFQDNNLNMIYTEHAWPMLMTGYIKHNNGVPFWIINGIIRRIANYFSIESQIGWVSSVKEKLSNITKDDVDIIMATSNPNVSFRLAYWLSIRLGKPFVLDYRDPWTENPHTSTIPKRQTKEEEQLLKNCSAATVVSKSWAKLIGDRFGVEKKIHVVSNGFDLEMFQNVTIKRFDHHAIVYAGALYPPKRVLDPFFKAFRIFLNNYPEFNVKFHYYGSYVESVKASAMESGVQEYTILHGSVNRHEALSAQKGACLNLIITSIRIEGTPSENGMLTGKIFDCMALNSTMLIIAENGNDCYSIIEESGGGKCMPSSDLYGMVDYIKDACTGNVPSFKDTSKYEWNYIGKKLDNILRGILDK